MTMWFLGSKNWCQSSCWKALLHGPEPSKAMFVVNFQSYPQFTSKREWGQKDEILRTLPIGLDSLPFTLPPPPPPSVAFDLSSSLGEFQTSNCKSKARAREKGRDPYREPSSADHSPPTGFPDKGLLVHGLLFPCPLQICLPCPSLPWSFQYLMVDGYFIFPLLINTMTTLLLIWGWNQRLHGNSCKTGYLPSCLFLPPPF